MQIDFRWDPQVAIMFPELALCIGAIADVRPEKDNPQFQRLKKAVYEEVRRKYKAETLKNNPIVRAYRDFYWTLGIDPTKIRPSGEALLRRVLHGGELPHISALVDAYNLASMQTIIPISGFDQDSVSPPLKIRFGVRGETFRGIGMANPVNLDDKMIVLADERQVLCIYPYRDSDRTKITEQTRNILVVAYGAPGVTSEQLRAAVEMALSYIQQIAGGETEMIKIFNSSCT